MSTVENEIRPDIKELKETGATNRDSITRLEKKTIQLTATIKWIDKLKWILLGAVISFLVYYFSKGL